MIISVSGKKGSGKDTVGKIIQILTDFPKMSEENIIKNINKTFYNQSFTNKKWADKLKDIVCILIGCTRKQLEDRDFKEKPLGEEWWYYKFGENTLLPYNNSKHPNSEEIEKYLIKLSPRLLLQLIGTDCMRNIIHPNIWVNSLMDSYKDQNWVITDTRFPNEYEAVKTEGFSILVSNTNLKTENEHISETALDGYDFDYYLDNTKQDYSSLIKDIKLILNMENLI